MQLIKTFIYGFSKPFKMVDILKKQDNPALGLVATILRGLIDSLLLFLPLFLMGRYPFMHSYLTFVKTENYFLFLVFVSPFFFLILWLFQSGFIYLIIRLSGNEKCKIDHILNIIGLLSLIVGSVLVLWDWIWIILNSDNYIWLGISHLLIDGWFVFLLAISVKEIMGIRIWLGIMLAILGIALALPPAMLIMRSPL
jgi:hypothetical protein